MKQIAVVYHSVTGTTAKLAQSVLEGCSTVTNTGIHNCPISEQDIEHGRFTNTAFLNTLDECDGIIWGCPTFMGSVSAQFKSLADASSERWESQQWRNKIASGFTVGANLSGDQLSTIQYFQTLSFQHGMIWSGLDIPGGYDEHNRNRLGAQGGLITHTLEEDLNPFDLKTAHYLGQRIAKLAHALRVHEIA